METGRTRLPVPLTGTDPFVNSPKSDDSPDKTKPMVRFWNISWLKEQLSRKQDKIDFSWIPYHPGLNFPSDPSNNKETFPGQFVDLTSFAKDLGKYPHHWPNNGIVYFYTMLLRLTQLKGLGTNPTVVGIYSMVMQGLSTQLLQFPEIPQLVVDVSIVTSKTFNHYSLMEIFTIINDTKWTSKELITLSWLCDLSFLLKIGRVLSSYSPGNLHELAVLASGTGLIIPDLQQLQTAEKPEIEAYSKVFSNTIVDHDTLLAYFDRWHRALSIIGLFRFSTDASIAVKLYPTDPNILKQLYLQRNMSKLAICPIYLACYDVADDRFYKQLLVQLEPAYYNTNFSGLSNIDAIMIAKGRKLLIDELDQLNDSRSRFLLDLVLIHMNLTPIKILSLRANSQVKPGQLTLYQAMELFSQGYLILPHHLANPSLYENMTCLLSHPLVTTPTNACFILTLDGIDWETIISWFSQEHIFSTERYDITKLLISSMLTGYPSIKYFRKLLKFAFTLEQQIQTHSQQEVTLTYCHCNSFIQLAQMIMERHLGGITDPIQYLTYIRNQPYTPSYIDSYYLILLTNLIHDDTSLVISQLIKMGLVVDHTAHRDDIMEDLNDNIKSYCQSLDMEAVRIDLASLYTSITPNKLRPIIDTSTLSCYTNKVLADFIRLHQPDNKTWKRNELIRVAVDIFHNKIK